MQAKEFPRKSLWLAAAAILALVWMPGESRALTELGRVAAAALIGLAVMSVRRIQRSDKPPSRSFDHAQVLLCVAGAMAAIVIGESLPRGLALAGGAAIIRFRTPVKDPSDAAFLFLLLGLGVACGLGAIALAGAGTLFLCALVAVLERIGRGRPAPAEKEAAPAEPLRMPSKGEAHAA